jgi:6,7-dimethyl-8-ribityllumazine synthase
MDDRIKTLEGDFNARGLRFGIVASRFNDFIVDRLLDEHVAREASSGIGHVSLTDEIPIGFGILTVDSIEQAIERAGTKAGNKGADAALAAIQMATLLRQLEQ